MGIYDREYYRDEPRRPGVASWSAVTTLIVINIAVFIADQFSPVARVLIPPGSLLEGHWLDLHMGLRSDLFHNPWNAWQLVTYGFLHDPNSIMHILFNMFGLWLFGRDVEAIYGKREFYRIYLSLVIMSGLGWVLLETVLVHPAPMVIGASGAVMGIMAIYVFHFPHRVFLIYGVIPLPAWVMGIVYVAMDIGGATGAIHNSTPVANTGHLAGVFFGILYFKTHWTLFSLWPGNWLGQSVRRPKYRVHHGDPEADARDDRQLQQQVDEILAKISREGEASLTPAERRTLEEASRRYRGQGPGARG